MKQKIIIALLIGIFTLFINPVLATPIFQEDLYGCTMLGAVDGAKNLLENGANPNLKFQNEEQTSILMEAARNGIIELVQLYIRYGANVNEKDSDSNTPLMYTINTPSSFVYLSNVGNKYTIAQLLINSGADINAKNNDGDTVLSLALKENMINIAKLLIKSGANVNAKNNDGKTILAVALNQLKDASNSSDNSINEIIQILRNAGAK